MGRHRLNGGRVIVQPAVSSNVEGPTKGWQVRCVPLADPARTVLSGGEEQVL
jgi:hypothetical protein